MKKVVDGKNISKYFTVGQEKTCVLKNINISVNIGEFVVIMGASGCGKSTLLSVLGGIDTASKGSVEIQGNLLTGLNEDKLSDIRRKEIGFIFQQPTFLKNLTIFDNIILPRVNENKKEKSKAIVKANLLMEKMGISNIKNHMVWQLSGGQLQRAGICRALINEPKVLLADEPTGALNSKSAEAIINLLVQINKKKMAILLVTHDSKVASKAQRILFMKDGDIVGELSLEDSTYSSEECEKEILLKIQKYGI